jgi:hypothetical protein
MQLPGADWAGLRMSPDESIDEPLVEANRLLLSVEGDGELLGAASPKVIACAAHRYNQCVVVDRASWCDLFPFSVEAGSELNFAPHPVKADHLPDVVAEMVVGSLREIIDGIATYVQRAGGYLMQVRLPNVSAGALDEGDLRHFSATEAVSEFSGEFDSACSAADDHNMMQGASRPLLSMLGSTK